MDQGYPYWRSAISFLLDAITAFMVFGFAVAYFTGDSSAAGGHVRFNLVGTPALVSFALIVAYFVVFNRFLGGTIWRRILKVAPRR